MAYKDTFLARYTWMEKYGIDPDGGLVLDRCSASIQDNGVSIVDRVWRNGRFTYKVSSSRQDKAAMLTRFHAEHIKAGHILA